MPDETQKALARARRIITHSQQLRDGLQGLLGIVADASADGLDLTAVDFAASGLAHTDGATLTQVLTAVQYVAQHVDATGLDGQPLAAGQPSLRSVFVKVCPS